MLFELRRVDDPPSGGLIGAERIVVLAIEPDAIAKPSDVGYGDWAMGVIRCLYVCEVDGRLAQLTSADLWADIEHGIYERVTPTAPRPLRPPRDLGRVR